MGWLGKEPVTDADLDPSRADAGVTEAVAAPDLEHLTAQLRRSYGAALAFARDLPVLGRCVVEVEPPYGPKREVRRWVARLPARLYVETHVRAQMDHLVDCLRDEMMDPEQEEGLAKIVAGLDGAAARLTGWRRVQAAVLRLPAVAAVVPVLTAAAADPFGDIGLSEVLDAASAVLVTALVTYGLAVWPSLRLGFRVKRAIFAGGVDLAQPFAAQPGTATWVGFRSRSPQPTGDIVVDFARWYRRRRGRAAEPARDGGSDDGGADGDLRLAFPRVHVYRHEDDVFGHIGRRKRGEMPVDLLFSLRPYLTTVTVVMLVVGFASFLAGGGLAEEPGTIFLVPVMVAIAFIPAQAFWELRANARRRQLH